MKPLKSLTIAILAAVLATGCASTRTQKSTGEFLDDAVITTRVKTALVADKQVSASRVDVETFKGVVQLSGFVNSEAERQRAVEIARNIEGIKLVRDSLVVK